MDRIVRRLIDKVTGEPLTGKAVAARPSTGGTDVPMLESAGGYYGTAEEVAHGEYKIIVELADSGDTVVVEPARTKRPGATTETCLIDKILQDKVRLSAYLGDATDIATHDNLVQALNQAAGSNRELVIDVDVATTQPITVSGSVRMDIGGSMLDLVGGGITCSERIFVMFGRVRSYPSRRLGASLREVYVAVEFTSDYPGASGNEQVIAEDGAKQVYLGCAGITISKFGTFGADNLPINMPVIVGNSEFGNANMLDLATDLLGTGQAKLDMLQSFINSQLQKVVDNAGTVGWLETNKTALNQWITQVNATTKATLATGIRDASYPYVTSMTSQRAQTPAILKRAGIQLGAEMVHLNGYEAPISYRGVLLATVTSDGTAARWLLTNYDNANGAPEFNDILQALVRDSLVELTLTVYSYNASTGVMTRVHPLVTPFIREIGPTSIVFDIGVALTLGATMICEFNISELQNDRSPVGYKA